MAEFTSENLLQIANLLLQCVIVAGIIFFLFRIRKLMGISMLFTALGVFQYMQVFLASTLYVEVFPGILASPGSTVLFTASIFAILLVYIREDAIETRKVIYALLIANIVVTLLLYLFSYNVNSSKIWNPYNLSSKLFVNNARILFVGTVTLLIDSILVIQIFELIIKFIRNTFFRILVTMLLVMTIDTVMFSIGALAGTDAFWDVLHSGLISKNAAVIVYSLLFTIYLTWIERDFDELLSQQTSFNDFFQTLTYRQKYEKVSKEKQLVESKAEKSEKKFRMLTEISPVGVFQTRPDGYTTFVNPKWCELSGLSFEEALGNGWLDALHPEDRIRIENGWEEATDNSMQSLASYRFMKKDGSIIWVMGQAVPEYNNNHEIIGYVGTITDITKIKETEIELKNAIEKAKESDKLKSTFLMNLSHEVRTPMNGIIGFTDLLAQDDISHSEKENYSSYINQCTKQLLTIIDDILEISYLETKQVKPEWKIINLNTVLNALFSLFEIKTKVKNIGLIFNEKLNDSEALIRIDESKLIKILSNILENAIKFTDKGSVEFGYKKTGSHYEIFVTDTGIGIDSDNYATIFNRFTQEDQKIKDNFGGLGLGLSIAKENTDLLGGTISVSSEKGKGTTFHLTFPNSAVDVQINGNIDKSASIEIENKTIKDQKFILIAEDEKMNFVFLKKVIGLLFPDISILHAENGKEVIYLVENNSVDLILMDIKMPIIDGIEATKIIRTKYKDLPVIAQSAYSSSEHKKKALHAGCNDFIEKPINKETLKQVIEKYL
jgi:PAS domain S-box-containing protein